MDRPRRRKGCLLVLAIAAILALALWLLLPRLLCLVANTRLPRELGQQATLLALEPTAHRQRTPPPILLEVDPALMRRIAADASGRWIPPGVVRHGLTAVGTLRGAGNITVPWQVMAVDGAVPPRLSVSLSPQQADALIAGSIRRSGGHGIAIAPELASAEVAALPDDGPSRRFRVEAAGSLRVSSGSVSVRLPVRRLVAEITIEFTPAEGGWEPGVRLDITALESPLPPIPGIDDAAWRKLLGAWAEGSIADQLAGRTIPAWFPTDLSLSAVVR